MGMFDLIVYLFLAHITFGLVASLIIIYLFFTDRLHAFIDRVKKHRRKNK